MLSELTSRLYDLRQAGHLRAEVWTDLEIALHLAAHCDLVEAAEALDAPPRDEVREAGVELARALPGGVALVGSDARDLLRALTIGLIRADPTVGLYFRRHPGERQWLMDEVGVDPLRHVPTLVALVRRLRASGAQADATLTARIGIAPRGDLSLDRARRDEIDLVAEAILDRGRLCVLRDAVRHVPGALERLHWGMYEDAFLRLIFTVREVCGGVTE